MEKTMAAIEYKRQGDYLLPNLTVPEEPEIHVGKYGELRRNYLKKEHSGIFINLLTQGKLNQHLAETQKAAQEMMERLTADLKEAQNVTEELKEKDQMLWLGMVNNIRQSAEEIVMKELVYS